MISQSFFVFKSHKAPLLLLFILLFFSIESIAASKGLIATQELDALNKIIAIVKSEYVDELSDEKISEYASKGLLQSLDPHSAYLDPKTYKEIKSTTKGEFGGLGMELTMENGILKVIAPYEESPAFKAGIRSGDYIGVIDSQVVKGLTLSEASERLRGAPGTSVALKVYRNERVPIDLVIEREIIKIVSVKSKMISDNTVGYIKIAFFNDKTVKTTKSAWTELKKNAPNMLGLILDLRSNPGGVLSQAQEIADLFLSGGDIVTVKSRDPSNKYTFKADQEDITHGLPIVVLINSGSASAAEIVAGALQDNKRAMVVGMKSFGKGSVQKIIPLSNGAAVKMTTSLYYTPSGNSIQANGIIPDIIVPEAIIKPINALSSISESALIGHIETPKDQTSVTIHENDKFIDLLSDDLLKDFQLLRAADTVKTMHLYKNIINDQHYVKKN